MEPWEALDVDYSDLHSLIRPLKRNHGSISPSVSASSGDISGQSPPILKPCSRPPLQSQSLSDNRQSHAHSSPENLVCQPERVSNQLEAPSTSAASPRIIPGPAGAVQAAMLRRTRSDTCAYVYDEEPVPTQEFIRRVIENGDEEDGDFHGNPWLCALDFVRGSGTMECSGAERETPLSSIKNGFNSEKIDLVIAIIKSCTPNGLGDMMVTLKDPTGTLDASIHHAAISEGNFGKDLSVGAVLVLKKVAVFSPTRLVHVLNITSRNLIKVIPKDSGPPVNHNHPTSAIKQLEPVPRESYGEVNRPPKVLSMSQGRTENIINNLIKQTSKLRGSVLDELQIGKGNTALNGNNLNRNQQTLIEEDNQMMDSNRALADIDQATAANEKTDQGTSSERAKENNVESNQSHAPTSDEEAQNMNGAEKSQTQIQQTPRSLLPQWTDEQLDELFAFN